MKKITSLVLAVLLLMSVTAIALSDEADTHFDSYITSANSNDTARVSFYFYTQATSSTAGTVGVTNYTVYEKAPTGSWANAGSYSGETRSNVGAHSFSRGHSAKSGYQYYCVATHYVFLNGTGRYATITSNTTTAK